MSSYFNSGEEKFELTGQSAIIKLPKLQVTETYFKVSVMALT